MKSILRMFALALILVGPALQADILTMDPAEQAPQADPERAPAQAQPPRGITMTEVERRLGNPEQKLAAVGDPPITRWVYPGFIVFFEHDRVLHSVVRR